MNCNALLNWADLLLVKFLVPLAWPLLGLAALLVFRKPLSDGIRRVVRLGMSGAELAPPQQDMTDGSGRQRKTFEAPALPLDPSIKDWEDVVDGELKQLEGMSEADIIARLKRALAYSNRNAAFENVGRLIYGTQISVLKHLATSTTGATESELRPIFNEHTRRVSSLDPKSSPSDFLAWIGFLQNKGMVGFENGHYVITERGRQFLQSATAHGINELRVG